MPNVPEERPQIVRQQGFVGGVQDFLPAHMIGETAARLLENVETHVHGTIRRRGGLVSRYQHTASSSDYALLQKSFFGIRDTQPLIATLYRTAIGTPGLTIDQGGANQQQITVSAPFSFDERSDVFQLLDRLYFSYTGLPLQYWEPGQPGLQEELATAGFSETTIPPAMTGCYFQGRGWVGGNPAKPDLVYYSTALGADENGETNDSPFTWDRYFQAFRMVTGSVEAILPFRNAALLIFTERGIETLEPNPNGINESYRLTLNHTTGCINRATIVAGGEEIYFMDQEGHVRSLAQTELDENRGVTNAPLSLPIQNVIDRQNKHFLRRARATFSKGYYWIAMAMDGAQVPNELWGFSIRDQAWIGPYKFGHDDIGAVPGFFAIGGLCGHRFADDIERLYVVAKNGSNAIKTYRALEPEVLTDDGVLIPVVIETASYSPASETMKTWHNIEQEMRFIHDPGDAVVSMLVEVRGDEAGYNTVTTSSITPDAGPNLPVDLPFYLVPYSRQQVKNALTGIPRSYGIQEKLTIRDSTSRWELVTTTVRGFIDEPNYAR